jgi:hypothetical protein
MLRGRWGQAVLAGLIAVILGGSGYDSGTSIGFSTSVNNNGAGIDYSNYFGQSDIQLYGLGWIGTFIKVGLVLTIAFLLIGGVVRVGYCAYNMKLVNGEPTRIGDLFSAMNRFGTCFVMNLVKSVLIAIGMFLFVIPGIILTYSYAMAPYILAEHPDYTATQALRESRTMMRGHKWRLFCLEFSFIGWALLAAVTCGIGLLWLTPYTEASTAIFYLELAGDFYSRV